MVVVVVGMLWGTALKLKYSVISTSSKTKYKTSDLSKFNCIKRMYCCHTRE